MIWGNKNESCPIPEPRCSNVLKHSVGIFNFDGNWHYFICFVWVTRDVRKKCKHCSWKRVRSFYCFLLPKRNSAHCVRQKVINPVPNKNLRNLFKKKTLTYLVKIIGKCKWSSSTQLKILNHINVHLIGR